MDYVKYLSMYITAYFMVKSYIIWTTLNISVYIDVYFNGKKLHHMDYIKYLSMYIDVYFNGKKVTSYGLC